MAELTPEERQRIYLEEKVRLEARRDIESKRITPGKFIGYALLVILGLFIVAWIAGSLEESAKTPEQRAKERAETCIQAEQIRLSEQGYSYEDGKLGAIMHCKEELDELHKFDKGGQDP
ncbi:MAG TPA: hypothetical protein VMB25_12300 [Bryobacteraceae bacterium]|nr:hypothetical protein [Bryobacteraceae bacterium]